MIRTTVGPELHGNVPPSFHHEVGTPRSTVTVVSSVMRVCDSDEHVSSKLDQYGSCTRQKQTCMRTGFDDGFEIEAPVGSFLPNPFGLYDVHGNVTEWTADIFVNRAYSTMEARPGDGLRYFARDWLPGLRYAVRGGDYAQPPVHARSGARRGSMAEIRWQQPGVRPARRVR